MGQVSLTYGDTSWSFGVPDDAVVVEDIPAEQVRPLLPDPVAGLREALAQPLGSEPIERLVDKDSRVAITVNDWMGGSYYAAPVVLDILRGRGVKDRNIRIMIAGGTHAKLTRKQLFVSNMGRWKAQDGRPYLEAFRILPPEIIEAWSTPGDERIERHDAADPGSLVSFGPSMAGDLVEVNKILLEADVVIHLGWGPLPLSPWGGFLGGGLLGLTSARSILGHHSPATMNHRDGTHGDPESQVYSHHKLALMEKIEESVSSKFFLIDPYFNAKGQFAGRWWTGHWRKLREAQIPYAMEEFKVRVKGSSADVVLLDCPPWMFHGATSSPLLAMSHVASALRGYLPPNPVLRKGGVVVCVTPCDGTIDDWYRPSDREVLRLYAGVGRDCDELFDRYAEDFLRRPEYIYKYRFCYGHHPLHPFWLLAAEQYVFDQSSKVIFAGAKDSEPLRQMGITAVPDLKAAWEMATATLENKHPDVTVLANCAKRFGPTFEIAKG